MNKQELYHALLGIMSENGVKMDEPMKDHTAFKIGGPADFMVLPSDAEEIEAVIRFLKSNGIEFLIMGNGSNLLVSDKGLRGVVIKIGERFSAMEIEGDRVRAQAGILLSTLAKNVAKASLSGLEFSGGIPGTLGGAVAMNAGAYGGEMKDVIESVSLMDKYGNRRRLDRQGMGLGYRDSLVQKEDLIVLEAELKLEPGDRGQITEKMNEFNRRRSDKQPLALPSAGSTFKRPEGHYAGKLIEDAGLKGLRYGNAMVSEKHSGFVVNMGNASAEEVLCLIRTVQKVVEDTFGVRLETEVKCVGE